MRSIIYLMVGVALIACNQVKETVKDTANSAGNAAGTVAGEFVEGAAGGVDKTFELKVELSKKLTDAGVKTGKCTFESDTTKANAGTDNVGVVYMIFDKSYKGEVTAKAFTVKGEEMGRSKVTVDGKTNDAKYVYFRFDKQTNLDADSKIVIE